MACVLSWCCPAVTIKRTGRPRPDESWLSICLGTAPQSAASSPLSRCGLRCVRTIMLSSRKWSLCRSAVRRANMRFHTPGPRPAGKAFIDALSVAVASRQVTPSRPTTSNPQYTIDKGPIVNGRPPAVPRFARQNILKSAPIAEDSIRSASPGSPPYLALHGFIAYAFNPGNCRFRLAPALSFGK